MTFGGGVVRSAFDDARAAWRPRARVAIAVLAVVTIAGGCGKNPNSASRNEAINGQFKGFASDSSNRINFMTWQLTQNGNSVTGSVEAVTGLGINTPVYRGTVSGSVAGTTLTFSIAVAAGSVVSFPTCTISLNGSATIEQFPPLRKTVLNGGYSGTSGCFGSISNGSIFLERDN